MLRRSDCPDVYEAVLFDVDGVLLRRQQNSFEGYHEVVEEAFRAFDVEPDPSDVAAFYGGASKSLDEMQTVCERHGVDFEAFWPERERRASELQRELIERGERELYDDWTALGTLAETHDAGLVSNNQHETVQFAVEHFGLDDHVETAYGREPTVEGFRRTKPDPLLLERALEDLATRSALFVGDGGHDVVAAHRAGIDSAFVWRDHRQGYELPEEPTHEIDRLTELSGLLSSEP